MQLAHGEVNIFGHTNEYISDRIKEQLERLEHVLTLQDLPYKPS